MTGLLDIAKKIKGNRCEQLVKYSGQEYTISGANVGLGTFRVDIGSFQNKVKEINAVPPVMMALDNNQYLLCQQASQLNYNPELKDACIRIRLMHIMAFTQLQALLSIPASSEELGKQILEWIKQMGKLTAQSIEMLAPQPKRTFYDAPQKAGPRSPGSLPQIKMRKVPAKIRVKPDIEEIMKYQGIDEAQMQQALKVLKE